MPSIITAAKLPLESSASTDSRLFSSAKTMFSVLLNGAWIFGLSVAATAPEVLPWKAFLNASTLALPVWNDATFRAFSFASAPLLQRNSP